MTDNKKEKQADPITMRTPFPDNQVNALPRRPFYISKVDWKNEKKSRCAICGGWHPDKAIHLDYVGHAAMTDRLLDVDPNWNWEPFAVDQNGLPAFSNGGLWIKLTVLGVTRNGFGDAGSKQGGDAVKEVIGDAIRNAAMRFGGALDLWHKGDLHEILLEDDEDKKEVETDRFITNQEAQEIVNLITETNSNVDAYLNVLGVESIDKITISNFEDAKSKLENKLKKMNKIQPETNKEQA